MLSFKFYCINNKTFDSHKKLQLLQQQYLVSHGQTTYFSQSPIVCDISTHKNKGLVSFKLVSLSNTSMQTRGIKYVWPTLHRQAPQC